MGVGGNDELIARRSHFVSICLLALASSIALTEYVAYSPVISDPSDDDKVLFLEMEEASFPGEEAVQKISEATDQTALLDDEGTPKEQQTAEALKPVQKTETDKIDQTITVNSGDTIISVLTKQGFDKTAIYLASKEFGKVFNLRSLKAGQEIQVKGHREEDQLILDSFEMKPDPRFKIEVLRQAPGKYQASKKEIPLKKVVKTVSGQMNSRDPLGSMVSCGAKQVVAREAFRILGLVADLRSSKDPISFELLYQDFYDPDGNLATKPELLYASALVRGKIFRVYKFRSEEGFSEYINSDGVTLNSLAKSKSMLAKPLSQMKITSKFGGRVHPVRRVWKRHTGVDLKASIGTPVRAAANGRVVKASYYSGYGKYIKLRHSGFIETAYGHLSRMIVKPNQMVKQGEVIGYVGVTGVTTGAHLHYEVLKNGCFINPMSVVQQEPEKLSGKKLAQFNRFKQEINLQVAGLSSSAGSKTSKAKRFS